MTRRRARRSTATTFTPPRNLREALALVDLRELITAVLVVSAVMIGNRAAPWLFAKAEDIVVTQAFFEFPMALLALFAGYAEARSSRLGRGVILLAGAAFVLLAGGAELMKDGSLGVEMDASDLRLHRARLDVQHRSQQREASDMKAKLVGIDLAKNVFQVCVIALNGSVLFNKKFSRNKFLEWLKDLEPTTVALEACGTGHFWGRKLQAAGHIVRLIPAQHVKAFCRVHKSDKGDALAITEAAQRPKMHFVPVKTLGQQDLQLLGRVRSKLVSQRTELISQVRGLAGEYGVTFPVSRAAFMTGLPLALEDADNGLTQLARFALRNALEDIRALDTRLAALATQTAAAAKQEPAYERLLTVPGFGPVVAPAFIAAVGNGQQFEHGRDVSAWLGIVPKQQGTGGKVQLMRISKNGDRELRTLLIHGARAVLRWVDRRDDPMSRWLLSLRARRGEARAIVALANKLARIGWAVLRGDKDFDVTKAFRPKAIKPQPAAA